MTTFDKKTLLEGKPFRVNFTHAGVAGYINRTAFDLDTVNWDVNADGILETTPFFNQMFIITGVVLIVGAGDTVGGIIIDGKAVTNFTNITAGTYIIDGRSQGATLPNYPPLANLYLEKGYIVRDKIEVWNSAGANPITINLVGYRLRRMN